MNLIDRDKIFPNGTFFASAEDPLASLDKLIERVWSLPIIDAVPVVRCKDCKHYNLTALACTHEYFNGWIGMNGFCSYAERKE